MSSDHWQQAKAALAEVMALTNDQRAAYLADLRDSSPDLHDEVVSLLESQAEADQQGFLDSPMESEFDTNPGSDHDQETMDQYRTETFDPAATRDYISAGSFEPPPKTPGTPNDLVGPDYELDKKIGQGGMGVVYKAYHRSLRRTVALKIITGGGLRDEVDIARFHIEAEAAARLDHPGIIPVYDVGEHNGNHYYAMAFVEGPSLSKYVGPKAKKLPPKQAAEIMEQVCRAVQFAHDRAVIHRDLKPANIMLENGEVPRLADFGLAKNMGEDDGLTMTGQVMGTPSYMAPEQATGKLDEISNRTDVYSLGATLYALLAGRPPFAGGTMLETIRQVVRADPEPLTQIVHAIPPDLQTICEKCLAKKPQDRYASADEVADDLQLFLERKPISARPLGFWARGWRLCQRHPVESSLLALALSAIIIGSVVSVNYGIQASRALAKANANAQELREAVKKTFVFASEDVLAQEPGMQAARATLLASAQQYYSDLVQQTPDDAKSQRALADAQFMLAKVQMALGDGSQAGISLSRALLTQQELLERKPEDVELLAAMAKTHNQLAIHAQQDWQAITQLQVDGSAADQDQAEASLRLADWESHSAKATELRKRVAQMLPTDSEAQRLYASSLMNEGSSINIRGVATRDLVQLDKAREVVLQAQTVRLEAIEDFPEANLIRRDLGRGYFNLANIEVNAADFELREEAMRNRWTLSVDDLTRAIQAYEKLPESELELDTRLECARCYRLRADVHFNLLDPERAYEDYQMAERLMALLSLRNPSVYRYRIVLAETQFNSCLVCYKFGQEQLGQQLLDRCRATLLQGLRIDPNNLVAAEQFYKFTQAISAAFTDNDSPNYEKAATVVQKAMDQMQALISESSEYKGLQPFMDKLGQLKARVRREVEQQQEDDSVT